MAKGKKRSPGAAAYYIRYKAEGRYAKNRAAALERHVDTNPNDKQAAERLNASGQFEYRRNVHGKSHMTKDTKAKYKLNAFVHSKPYPPKKRITVNTNPIKVGDTIREQIGGYA